MEHFKRIAQNIMIECGIDPRGEMTPVQLMKFQIALGRHLMANPLGNR